MKRYSVGFLTLGIACLFLLAFNASAQLVSVLSTATTINYCGPQKDLAIVKQGSINGYVSTASGMKPVIRYTITITNLGNCVANIHGQTVSDRIGNLGGEFIPGACVNSAPYNPCTTLPTAGPYPNIQWTPVAGATLPPFGSVTLGFDAISYETTSQKNIVSLVGVNETNMTNNLSIIDTPIQGYGYGNLTAGSSTTFAREGVKAVVKKLQK